MDIQLQEPNVPHGPIKIAVGTFVLMGLSRLVMESFIPKERVKKFVKAVGPKTWAVVGGVALVATAMYVLERKQANADTASALPVQFTVF